MKDERYFDFDESDYEPCPECGEETVASADGKSTCEHCGHKNVLPCNICKLNYNMKCDWTGGHCTPFPKKQTS